MSAEPRDRWLASDASMWTEQIVLPKERAEHRGPFLVVQVGCPVRPPVGDDLDEGFCLAVGLGTVGPGLERADTAMFEVCQKRIAAVVRIDSEQRERQVGHDV